MNKFAVSDIHGCLKTFKALLEKINFSKEDELYLLGDYIDRGRDSKGVIDHIWDLQNQGYTVKCLRGNHEQMLLEGVVDDNKVFRWERNGGDATLYSFNCSGVSDIPIKYINWMDALPYYLEVDNYILVHAGFKFALPNPFDEKDAMIWERVWYDRINHTWLDGRIIIHGHTPTRKHEIVRMLKSIATLPVVDIDCGCVFNFVPGAGFGHLCALELTTQTLHFQITVEKVNEQL